MKAIASTMAVMLLAAAAPVAFADADADADGAGAPQHEWHHQDWHHHGGMVRMFHELGLTEKQRSDVRAALEAAQPAIESLREEMRSNAQLLRQTSPDDKSYAQVVARVSRENGELEGRMISARSKLYAQCYALLAPIQKTRLAEVQAQHAKWAGERGEHLREHPHGHDGNDGHDGHEGHDMGKPQADAAQPADAGPAA